MRKLKRRKTKKRKQKMIKKLTNTCQIKTNPISKREAVIKENQMLLSILRSLMMVNHLLRIRKTTRIRMLRKKMIRNLMPRKKTLTLTRMLIL